MPRRLLDDLAGLAFAAPAAVLALPALVSGRARPTRLPIPSQPLVWPAVVCAALSLTPIAAGGTTATRATAAGLACLELAALLLLGMRLAYQWGWARRTSRVPARLPITAAGRTGATIDISTGGAAAEGLAPLRSGDRVPCSIGLDDGTVLTVSATVVGRRRSGDVDVTGLALEPAAGDIARWDRQLARAAVRAAATPRPPALAAPSTSRISPARRTTVVLVEVVSACFVLAALSMLCLTLIGYRPMIVRSGSMQPALQVGDVVVVEDVEARQLVAGDIATFTDPIAGGSLTHRVRAVSTEGATLTIVTRGDANSGDEELRVAPDALVGKVVARVPRIGAALAWAGTTRSRAAGAAVAVGAAGGAAVGLRRRSRPRAAA
jgi:signal peptidase I